MMRKKTDIVIGLTTFDNERLKISIPALGKLRQKFHITHRWEHSEQWRHLLLQAEEAKLPDELWTTLNPNGSYSVTMTI